MAEAVKTIEDALFARFGERFAVDATLPGLAELARLTARRVCRRYAARDARARSAAAVVRGRVERAVEKRSAAGRHSHRAGKGPARPHRRSAAGDAVAARGARVPGVPGQWTARAANVGAARQAVSQRPSRPVLQRHGGRRDRARHLPARGRSGGARLLPDQRDPRSCARHRRPAGAAGEGGAGGRHGGRLAGGGGGDFAAAAAFHDRARGALRGRRSGRAGRRLRPPARGDADPTATSATSRASAARNSTAGRRTRRGNTPCRSAPISAPSCGRKGFISTDPTLVEPTPLTAGPTSNASGRCGRARPAIPQVSRRRRWRGGRSTTAARPARVRAAWRRACPRRPPSASPRRARW